MKNDIKQLKTYMCLHCKKKSEIVGIVQRELRYYSLNLETNQWEDFHGNESVEMQELFCINCREKINDKILA
jgi:hypothetical protein